MTKKQEALLDNYRRATATKLADVYKSWSAAKERGWNYCENLRAQLGGYGVRVPSANTFQFTYAFRFMLNGQEWLCYCTASNDYKFCIE